MQGFYLTFQQMSFRLFILSLHAPTIWAHAPDFFHLILNLFTKATLILYFVSTFKPCNIFSRLSLHWLEGISLAWIFESVTLYLTPLLLERTLLCFCFCPSPWVNSYQILFLWSFYTRIASNSWSKELIINSNKRK